MRRWLPLVLSVLLLGAPSVALGQSVSELFQEGKTAQAEGRFSDAEAIWNRVLEQNLGHRTRASAYNNLGNVLSNQGRYEEAEVALLRALDLDPNNAIIYNNLGNVLSQQGRYEEAEAALRQVLSLDPNYAAPYNNLGGVLFQQGRYEESLESCQQVLRLPDRFATASAGSHAFARNCLGLTLQELERYSEAITEFKIAIELAPTWSTPKNNLRETERLLTLVTMPTYLDDRAFVRDDRISQLRRSVVRIITKTPEGNGEGTGWVIDRKGNTVLVVTNRHVLTPDNKASTPILSEEIQVDWFSEVPNRVFCRQPARILHHSSDPDLAILEVRDAPDDIKPLDLSFDRPDILASMLIVGHPVTGAPWTVVRGDINNNLDLLQMTATIAPGNSGGPVLDENDRVVGMMLKVEVSDVATGGFAMAYPLDRLRSQLETWGVLP